MNSVTINGKTYRGVHSISVVNNRVIVDGKPVDHGKVENGILEVRVDGVLDKLEADGSVHCNDVRGYVQAGGSVTCDNVGSTVQAGGSVTCNNVAGSIMAGGSVRHR